MPRSSRRKGDYTNEIRELVGNLLTDPRFEVAIRGDEEWWEFIGSLSPRGTELHPAVRSFFGESFQYVQDMLLDVGIVPSRFFIREREVFRWRDAITGRFLPSQEVLFTIYEIFLPL